MFNDKRILAIIPAREGSKGIVNKNIVIHRKLTNFKVNLINLLINTFSFNSTLIFYKH